jgi:hypothetical protein
MKTDERDDRLADVLDRAARSTSPPQRLDPVLKRGGRRRTIRWTAIVIALALFVGAVTWTALDLQANGTKWSTYSGANDKWRLAYRSDWYVTKIAGDCTYKGYRGGVIISSVDFPWRTPRGTLQDCGQRYIFAGFPPDGVAIGVDPAFFLGSGISLFREPDTAFPLTPQTLFPDGEIRGGPRETELGITVHGETIYSVRAWVGSAASSSDKAALDRLISSIDFASAPRWITVRGDAGYSVSYPQNWYYTPGSPKTHGLVQQVFSLSTQRPLFTNEIACTRTQAALIVVNEVPLFTGQNYPPRQGTYGSRPPDKTNRYCTGWFHKEWEFRFHDRGRYFDAVVAVVQGDGGDIRSTAFRVLNSLHFFPIVNSVGAHKQTPNP